MSRAEFDTGFPAELGDPASYPYSERRGSGNVCSLWHTWAMETHIQRLYERCDNLLALALKQQREIEELQSSSQPKGGTP